LNDCSGYALLRKALIVFLLSFSITEPLVAGEEIIYEQLPDWVEQADIESLGSNQKGGLILLDQQSRIEQGQLWSYIETGFAFNTPESLTQFGTLSAAWLPDKGDLRIHHVELIRGDQVIDLLASGERFDVLRREQGLEIRLLTGILTATMPVSGAQIGDIVRLAYSTTLSDQALGEEVQWRGAFLGEHVSLSHGQVSVSWPADLTVARFARGDAEAIEPTLVDGYWEWSVQLPVSKPQLMPLDAPTRFRRGHQMQVTTYPDWQSVSRQMSQHYAVTGAIEPGGALASEIEAIARKSDDDLMRTMLALRLVQDQISYLLDGLDGGNYLPQTPEETWRLRYGDCKAKSVLLLAILQELGIESEVALVSSQGGDALPQLAPMPANFDHMIVHAKIDGTSYWLDGTITGASLETIDAIPRFFFALPINPEGQGLVKLEERATAIPDEEIQIRIDQRAGVRLPSLVSIELEVRGGGAAVFRAIAEDNQGDQIKSVATSLLRKYVGSGQVLDHSVRFDETRRVAIIEAEGIMTTPWDRANQVYELDPPGQPIKEISFETDRARSEWRGIPVILNGPTHRKSTFEILLPESGGHFELIGQSILTENIGGIEVSSEASLQENRFEMVQVIKSSREELPSAELPIARRTLTRVNRSLPQLRAPEKIRQLWEFFGPDRSLLERHEAAYAKAVEQSDADSEVALLNRARFRVGVYDFAGALEDIDAAHEIKASRQTLFFRSMTLASIGEFEDALSDIRKYEEQVADGSSFGQQIRFLAHLGRADELLQLAQSAEGLMETVEEERMLLAEALGWTGSRERGLNMFRELTEQYPGDSVLLNNYCWYAGIWDLVTEEVLASCTDAVERSESTAAALDSRALAYFRLGHFEAAMSDLDAALLINPSLAESRMLRGLVRIATGDATGQAEVDLALLMHPALASDYRAWGLLR
jgi:tetratricopeptide (TPR) repeat protein